MDRIAKLNLKRASKDVPKAKDRKGKVERAHSESGLLRKQGAKT